jgi:hypothetical protein
MFRSMWLCPMMQLGDFTRASYTRKNRSINWLQETKNNTTR